MSGYLILGRRRADFGLMIDFHKTRAIVRSNTSWIDGIALEEIPPGTSGYKRAMILVQKNWNNLYFINEREGWTDQQYFTLAEKIMKQRGIKKP